MADGSDATGEEEMSETPLVLDGSRNSDHSATHSGARSVLNSMAAEEGSKGNMRRSESCINCGEVREIAARGLCFKCYRQAERAGDRQRISVDRHNPGVRPEHKKLVRGFAAVIAGLGDLRVSRDDVMTIRRVLDPYLAPVGNLLAPALEQEKTEAEVNGEHNAQKCSPFTQDPMLRGV
jgi:hypothetical protein